MKAGGVTLVWLRMNKIWSCCVCFIIRVFRLSFHLSWSLLLQQRLHRLWQPEDAAGSSDCYASGEKHGGASGVCDRNTGLY